MFILSFAVNENIIKKKILAQTSLRLEEAIHQVLEGDKSISKPKGHD